MHMLKEHFNNLFGKSPKVTNKPLTKIINNQLDMKLGQFTQEELNVVLTKIKNRAAVGLGEIPPPEVWKTRKFDDLLLRYFNAVNKPNAIDRWDNRRRLHPPFSQKGWPRGGQELPRYNPYIHQVKLATAVEGDPKAPVLIATTSRCRDWWYSFPWIAPLYP